MAIDGYILPLDSEHFTPQPHPPFRMTLVSSAMRVFDIPELCDNILSGLAKDDLAALARVSRATFAAVVPKLYDTVPGEALKYVNRTRNRGSMYADAIRTVTIDYKSAQKHFATTDSFDFQHALAAYKTRIISPRDFEASDDIRGRFYDFLVKIGRRWRSTCPNLSTIRSSTLPQLFEHPVCTPAFSLKLPADVNQQSTVTTYIDIDIYPSFDWRYVNFSPPHVHLLGRAISELHKEELILDLALPHSVLDAMEAPNPAASLGTLTVFDMAMCPPFAIEVKQFVGTWSGFTENYIFSTDSRGCLEEIDIRTLKSFEEFVLEAEKLGACSLDLFYGVLRVNIGDLPCLVDLLSRTKVKVGYLPLDVFFEARNVGGNNLSVLRSLPRSTFKCCEPIELALMREIGYACECCQGSRDECVNLPPSVEYIVDNKGFDEIDLHLCLAVLMSDTTGTTMLLREYSEYRPDINDVDEDRMAAIIAFNRDIASRSPAEREILSTIDLRSLGCFRYDTIKYVQFDPSGQPMHIQDYISKHLIPPLAAKAVVDLGHMASRVVEEGAPTLDHFPVAKAPAACGDARGDPKGDFLGGSKATDELMRLREICMQITADKKRWESLGRKYY